MSFTDRELIRAAQIAYFTIDNDVISQAKSTSFTLSEIFNSSDKFRNSIYGDISMAVGFTVTESDIRSDVLNYIAQN